MLLDCCGGSEAPLSDLQGFGVSAQGPKGHRGMDMLGNIGQEEGEENLNKVSNRPVGSLHMSARIAEPALWCLLTRLGENFEVFTAIINQERAWFFPGLGAPSHLLLADAKRLSRPMNTSRLYNHGNQS